MSDTRQSKTLTRRSLLGTTFVAVSSVAGAGLLAACGQAPAPVAAPTTAPTAAAASTSVTPTTAPAAIVAPAGEKITLKVFNRGTPTNEVCKGSAAEFMAAHQNVTIDWQSAPPHDDFQKMLVLAAAGTSPDIQWQCMGCYYDQFVLAGLVLEHDPLIKSHSYSIATQMPSAIQSGTRSGKLYGLPNALHPDYACVVINKTMFQKAGVPIPKEEWTDGPHPGWKSWTFDDMKNAAIALTKRENNGRIIQWGLQTNGAANPHDVIREAMRSEGMDAINQDGTKLQWTSDVGRKVIGYYSDLYTKAKVAPLTADMPKGGPDLMASNRVAIRNAPIWAIQTATQTFKDFEWQFLPAPRGAAGADANTGPNFFSIMKVTKYPDMAFDMLVAIIDPKWGWKSVDLGGIPGSQKEFWAPDSRLVKDPNFAIFARMMNTVSPDVLPKNARSDELTNAWLAGMDPIWLGQTVDTNQLIDQLNPKLQAILDKPPATIAELSKPA